MLHHLNPDCTGIKIIIHDSEQYHLLNTVQAPKTAGVGRGHILTDQNRPQCILIPDGMVKCAILYCCFKFCGFFPAQKPDQARKGDMDPLTVLSIASATAQPLDFAASLYSAVNEIAETGKTSDVRHFETLSEDFFSVSASLGNRFRDIDNTTFLKAAFRTVWIRSEIERLYRRLSEYRSELTLRLLLVLNSQVERQAGITEDLRDDIIEVLSINARSVQLSLDNHYNKTIAAILTTRAGQSTIIRSSQDTMFSYPDGPRSVTVYTPDDARAGTGADFRTKTTAPDCTQKLIDTLHFREIAHRVSKIPKAHKNTFPWVWKTSYSGSTQQRWDNLADWLLRGSGCYWVSGKAGSGKSSLMKYIQTHTQTLALLRNWAKGSDLVLGSFFSYAGSHLQKSRFTTKLLLETINSRN
ncbi:hypothetical protein CHU98_g12444 [Xylaria longipes]|nr:hypothetical protein CHU98_g12444 [Xylaria longipes]